MSHYLLSSVLTSTNIRAESEKSGQRNEEILHSPHYLPQKGQRSRNRDLLSTANRKGIAICLRAKPVETGTISRITYFTADSGIGGGRQKLNPEAHVQRC